MTIHHSLVDRSVKDRSLSAAGALRGWVFALYGVRPPDDINVLSNPDPTVAENLGSRIAGKLEQV